MYEMKLSEYAKKNNVTYRTAWNHWKSGKLEATQLASGTIVVGAAHKKDYELRVVIYTRVSSSDNKANLDTQADRLVTYCMAKGYKIDRIIKEVGSGVNDTRAKLQNLLNSDDYDIIVIEHKDRLTRFGFNYIKTLLEKNEKKIDVVNAVDNDRDDLMQDFISIITSFCARVYGQRRTRRKTEKLIRQLENDNVLQD